MKKKRLKFHQTSGGYSQTEILSEDDFEITNFDGMVKLKGEPELIINLKNVTCVEIETLESEE